jgi:hypothetical protein
VLGKTILAATGLGTVCYFLHGYRSILVDALLGLVENFKHLLVLKVFDLVSQGTETYQMKLK